MRDLALDIGAVCAGEAGELDGAVIDGEFVATAEEALGEDHVGALAEVVGALFEGQAVEGDAGAAVPGDDGEGGVDDGLVAGEDVAEEGGGDLRLVGKGQEAADVLGQAGAAEGEARGEVGARDVERAVLAKQVEGGAGVDAHGGKDGAGFVGEGELRSVEGVGEVFGRLGGGVVDDMEVAGNGRVEFAQNAGVVAGRGADEGERGVLEVADGGAFAEEFGVRVVAEAVAVGCPGGLFQGGDDAAGGGARGTVERMTMVWGVVLVRRAAPICWVTASMARRSTAPSGRLGVPTAMKERSVSAMAWGRSVVAERAPRCTAVAIRSSIWASTMGEWPAASMAVLSGLVSTPMIWWPSAARHPAETAPT